MVYIFLKEHKLILVNPCMITNFLDTLMIFKSIKLSLEILNHSLIASQIV